MEQKALEPEEEKLVTPVELGEPLFPSEPLFPTEPLVPPPSEPFVPDRIRQTQRHLTAVALTPFQTEQFNIGLIEDIFRRNISDLGEPIDPDSFARELSDVISTGFAQALATGDELGVDSAINTITQAVTKFGMGDDDPGKIVSLANALIEEFTRALPKDSHTPALDISEVVDDIFGPELDRLTSRELSSEQLGEIRLDLGKDLLRNPRTIEELEDLIVYVEKNVQINVLKRSLIADIRDRIRRRQILVQGELISRVPPILIEPISTTRALVIQRPILNDFSLALNQKVLQWQTRLDTLRPDKQAILKEIRAEVDLVNNLFIKGKIRRKGTDRTFRIKTSRQSAQASLNLIKDAIRNVLGNTSLTFTYVPPVSRGMPQDITSLLTELRQILNRGKKSINKPILPSPNRRSEFGGIVITRSGEKREIVMGPGTSLSDIMKLAKALVMEPGTLEDISGREVLNIIKSTKSGEVVSFIAVIFENSVGHVARFTYIPDKQGEHVGGFLESLPMRGMILPIETSLDSARAMRAKGAILSSTLGEFTRFGVKPVKGGAIPAVAAAAAVLAKPIASIADKIGKALPPLKIITAPIKAVANIVSKIGRIFGF